MLNNVFKFIFTAWKKPIILMATTGIGFGILGEGLMIITALLRICTSKVGVHLCLKMLATTSILCACELTFEIRYTLTFITIFVSYSLFLI